MASNPTRVARRRTGLRHAVLCFALTCIFLAPAVAEDEKKGDGPPPAPTKPEYGTREAAGVGREGMWVAPTADDWQKPCLITFQRTWEDAVAVSSETGKPILCCINMDGEIASEHYAGKRYREPAICELYKPYVCVIASVYRHTPRDYDDDGRRILCPRFGSVTCGEHIAIEPILYEKYLDGKRIAPRHVMVDLAGNEVYDVYYANDTASVFDAIRDGPEKVAPPKPDVVRGDRPILERVASRHVEDRQAVEQAYRDGDAAMRAKLLEAAAQHPDAAPLDLLRQAVFGLDVDLGKAARQALAETKSSDATPLISEALQAPMETSEREALLAALKRLGDNSELARWLTGVHQGLGGASSAVDPAAWAKALEAGAASRPEPKDPLTTRAEDMARSAYERPDDPAPRLDYAEATLEQALETRRTYVSNPNLGKRFERHLYADALRVGLEAEKLGATGWRVNAVLALAAYYGGDPETGYVRAEAAMPDLPPGAATWSSMAVVTVFAESRWKAIKKAVKAKEDWPPSWLADVHSAYAVLRNHPLGTDGQVVWHYDLLMWLGARQKAVAVLMDGIERFRDSEALHRLLRERMLRWRGPQGLEETYERMLTQHEDPARLEAFAALASLEAGDQYRRASRFEEARAAYTRAIGHYEQAVEAYEGHRDGADVAIALALAARARVAYQVDDDKAALADILASFQRSPGTAGTRDGMGITPGETAQMLLARLKENGQAEAAQSLEDALSKLDPELLLPDRP